MKRLSAIGRAHRPFIFLLAGGAALRMVALFAYRPALLLQRDAYAYLKDAHESPLSGGLRPALYPIFLKPAVAAHDLTLVAALQHAMGLAVAIGLYALCRRLGLGPLAGALASAPVLLDGYQIELEHFILAESLFELFAALALVAVVWPYRKAWGATVLGPAAAGTLIALAFLTRYVGAALLVAALIYLLIRDGSARARLLSCAVLAACCAAPVIAYTSTLDAPSATDKIGFPLWGRVAAFVDCSRLTLPPDERPLCTEWVPRNWDHHLTIWYSESPLDALGGASNPRTGGLLRDFAFRAIKDQPLGYLASVGHDLVTYFSPVPPSVLDSKVSLWLFPRSLDDARPVHQQVERLGGSPPPGLGFHDRFRIIRPAADGLRLYELVVYTWGPLLAAAIALGAVGGWAGRRADSGALAAAGLLFSLAILGLLLARLTVGVYGYRYMIVTIPFVGPAAVIGFSIFSRTGFRLRPHRQPGR